jgi:uncharacterized protein YbjT (DUF2867 family)
MRMDSLTVIRPIVQGTDLSHALLMNRTILVTGATGTVSSSVLDLLRPHAEKVTVRALVRREDAAAKLRASGIDAVLGDLDDPESLSRPFEGVSDLWFLSPPGPRAPENAMNALWAARKAGVSRVVRMSAIGAAHDAPSRNGRLHALSDAELQASGLRWTILRPHFFMQNLLAATGTVEAQSSLYFALGTGRLGLVDTRDIADVAAAVLLDESKRHDGKIYTPTGPQSIGMADVAATLGKVLARDVRYVPVSEEAAREAMLGSGMSPWMTGLLVEYMRAYASGWGDFTTPHVAEVTGKPARDFATFAREVWPRGR